VIFPIGNWPDSLNFADKFGTQPAIRLFRCIPREMPIHCYASLKFSPADRAGLMIIGVVTMAKTQRKLKKANHGKRPASAKARRAKRKHLRFS